MPRPDAPYKRTYESGRTVWTARYTDPRTGERRLARPAWNRGRSTFELRRDAQRAIAEAIEAALRGESRTDTFGSYASSWTARRPRSERTNRTNDGRLRQVLDVELGGRRLRDWPLCDLRRRHGFDLADHLLRVQGRSVLGASNVLRACSAMMEDAITDELAIANPFKGLRLRASDPRARKQPREKQVWTFEEMHAFAKAAGQHFASAEQEVGEGVPAPRAKAGNTRVSPSLKTLRAEAMIRVLSDCGLRLGEMLALRIADLEGGRLHVRGNAHEGRIETAEGATKHHRRPVPVPADLADKLAVLVEHSTSELLFPTPTGKVWRERNWYRDVWEPTRKATGLAIRPHELRHSYITHLRAAGIDDADLAQVAGHRLETMLGVYAHPLGRSDEAIRKAVG